ncbi:MAG TPA: ComEC/Rec2 family competence protein [Candidatus Paceibacterota bacterium]|nr:ComEC/Rec2 family competence protein [Candidatus Paceibacterota bacterium]
MGAKDSLGKEWLDKFKIAGLSHIIVLSGYNLTIIADSVMKVVSRFSTGILPSVFGAISVVLFTIMTGAGASTVRAAIMALIILLAKTTGRVYEASSALIVAGVLMIIENPRVLVFDMSFQLSFLATLGLLYVSPLVKERLKFVTEKLGLREMLSATIGAQIATSPLIIYKMGTFSLVALPANILVVLLIPITMFFGFLAAIVGFINYYIAIPFAAVAWLLLSYILSVVDIFSSLPFATINITALSVLSISVLIFACVFVYKRRDIFSSEIDQWKIEEIN